QLMAEATRLTKSGNLAAATAAIQAALMGGAPVAVASPPEDAVNVQTLQAPASGKSPDRVLAAINGVVSPTLDSAGQGDTFKEHSFSNESGQRSYKLYVPPQAGDRLLPLVVMLHGCKQDADDFAAGTAMNEAAREQGFYVLYPVQSRRSNPQKCWNWFKHNHQQAGRGEPAILAAMTREVIGTHQIDPHRVYVAGLSAGGAMAAILASEYPDLYAAAGMHSGLAPGIASDLPSALAAMKGDGNLSPTHKASGVPTIVFHGDKDGTVHPANAEAVIQASAGSSPSQSHSLPASDGQY